MTEQEKFDAMFSGPLKGEGKPITIADSLALLDPENDDHWTKGGLPRMNVIEALVGDKTITREDVSEARHGLCRQALRDEGATTAAPTGICGHMFNGKCQVANFTPTGPCHCSQDTRTVR